MGEAKWAIMKKKPQTKNKDKKTMICATIGGSPELGS